MASFGVRLKEQREQRGITLEEISGATKIGTRMLVALEQDHFDQLPGGIFNKGFIRAYARCLGIDEEQAIADYLVASGNLPSEKEKDKDKKSDAIGETSAFALQSEGERRESSLPWGTFAILLLLTALGFAVWGIYSRAVRKNARKTDIAAAQVSEAESPPITATPPAEPKLQAAPVAKPVSAKSVEAASASASPNSQLPAVSAPLTLRITLHADSWLSITSDGRQVLQGSSFSAPTEKTIRAAREIVVKAGNAAALDLEFNGKKLPAQGAEGEVKTLTFDASGVHVSAPPRITPLP
ncbi:MAG: helix-turn-helix domain-containing protein [Terriglobales bacterium]